MFNILTKDAMKTPSINMAAHHWHCFTSVLYIPIGNQVNVDDMLNFMYMCTVQKQYGCLIRNVRVILSFISLTRVMR